MSQSSPQDSVEALAIVGMSCRFPGAPDIHTFWQNLKNSVESIEFFSDEELAAAGVVEQLLANPAYVKACGVCKDEDKFDAGYFGFSPREAQVMDPQQRVFLECAVEALENAGLDPDSFAGPIGVYAGVGVSTYLKLIEASPGFAELVGGLQVLIGTNKDHLTTHVSYKLNLRGPSIAVQTACSTSLVAVVQACQALLTYQCDAALAGGVSIAVPQREGYLYEEGGIESPDGHCRAFDARAEGTVGGNGAGAVVLKRLSDARAAGDRVYALIRGFAVNNDGADKVGYTAPSIRGQAEVIALAQGMAGVDPDTITYIEAHGTATPLGDPIEIAALTQAFRLRTSRTQFCAVGSVKTNIGHLDCAAGVAGLIKTVLAIQHRQIPASLHFTAPNPRIDFAASPFFVNTKLTEWSAPFPRRAGVSSFGIGGTNAHVIVEEPPAADASEPMRTVQVITLSARTPEALQRARHRLAQHLETHPDIELVDACFTLHTGRRAHERRMAFTCCTTTDAVAALRGVSGIPIHTKAVSRKEVPVAFLFPGQGSQYAGMARELYRDEPAFREALDECAEMLRGPLGRDMRVLCLCDSSAEATAALSETWIAQPALFSVQYALARTWLSWGVRPSAMLGHSVGEYTAACLAGVFTLEDALRLVAARGRLVQSAPRGAMLAVPLAAADVIGLGDGIEVAAVNAPLLTTAAGETGAIERFADRLRARGIESKRLQTSHAFHSRALDPILETFRAEVAHVPRQSPALPYISNVTGTWITADEVADPDYYVRQLRETVQFAEGLQTLIVAGMSVFLEVGPGNALTSIIRKQLPAGSDIIAVSSLGFRRRGGDSQALANTLGQLWCCGVAVDWGAFHARERRRKVQLPGYPFDRRRYWVDAPAETYSVVAEGDRQQVSDSDDMSVQLYLPSWSRGQSLVEGVTALPEDEPGTCWLILRDASGLGDQLRAQLERAGRQVITVDPSAGFEQLANGHYRIGQCESNDYIRLLDCLSERQLWPSRIFHLWGLDRSTMATGFTALQERGSLSLAALAHGLMRRGDVQPTSVVVVTTATQRVLDSDRLEPARATIFGPCRTIPQECPAINCRVLDIQCPMDSTWRPAVVARILAEATSMPGEVTVAYRGGFRWLQTYEPVGGDAERPTLQLQQGGVYLITGGLGRLGLLIARWVASRTQARLILTSRTRLPPKADWSRQLREDGESDTSAIIGQLREIEQSGSIVDVLAIDASDEAAMTAALAEVLSRGGTVNGVFHCAGATRPEHFASIKSVTRALWEDHFRPKSVGVAALDRALQGHSPEFIVLMSSLSSVLGGLGFMPYAAANAFMDAFAEAKPRDEKPRWISINWDGWSLDSDDDSLSADAEEQPRDGLTVAEGLAALERILACPPAPQVLVVAGELEPRLRQWVDLLDVREAAPHGDHLSVLQSEAHQRPQLTTAYREPSGDLEQQMAVLWQELLGVTRIGADDNFFELGGHSLVAIQLAARIRERYRIELAVDVVFNAPTVAALTLEVHRRSDGLGALDQTALEDLMTQVERMDQEQIRALLAEDVSVAVPEDES